MQGFIPYIFSAWEGYHIRQRDYKHPLKLSTQTLDGGDIFIKDKSNYCFEMLCAKIIALATYIYKKQDAIGVTKMQHEKKNSIMCR